MGCLSREVSAWGCVPRGLSIQGGVCTGGSGGWVAAWGNIEIFMIKESRRARIVKEH